jgi:tetratricopeptide (TPR) repeat protein
MTGDFDTSYVYYQKALEIFKADRDTSNIGKVYNNLALLFTHREYYHLALEYNLKSLEYAKLLNDPKAKFHSYNNIGITYKKLGEYEKAIEAYLNDLNIASTSEDALNQLMNGEAHALFPYKTGSKWLCSETNTLESDVSKQFVIGDYQYYIAFFLNTPASTVAEWQNSLDVIKNDGGFETIWNR